MVVSDEFGVTEQLLDPVQDGQNKCSILGTLHVFIDSVDAILDNVWLLAHIIRVQLEDAFYDLKDL